MQAAIQRNIGHPQAAQPHPAPFAPNVAQRQMAPHVQAAIQRNIGPQHQTAQRKAAFPHQPPPVAQAFSKRPGTSPRIASQCVVLPCSCAWLEAGYRLITSPTTNHTEGSVMLAFLYDLLSIIFGTNGLGAKGKRVRRVSA